MFEWVEKLLVVQDKDLRIAKLQEQVQSVPTGKAKVNDMLRENERGIGAAREALQEHEKALKHLEMEVEGLRQKKADFQAKSTMIKSNEEYRAALHQIDQCSHHIEQLEDQELEIMENLEQARSTLRQKQKEFEEAKQRASEMNADFDTRLKNCEQQVAKLKAERDEALKDVDRTMAARYERLLQHAGKRFGDYRVLVPVRDDVCDRCRMNVTAQTRMNARKGMLVSCENCGAMLYHEED